MARSIYLVTKAQCVPVATFSVKKDCAAWLDERDALDCWYVIRFPDGGRGDMSDPIPARDFLASTSTVSLA
jgi:hypothetical protein